jgi:hypothetical protein
VIEPQPVPGVAAADPAAAATAPLSVMGRLKRFYHENEPACTVAFFVAGFLFDTIAVGRIDKLHNVIHQASYLFLCALFTSWELRENHGLFTPHARLQAAWRYHTGATHFMLGTLLNIYTLFYFKSASLGTSFLFLAILAGLLAINELKPFKDSGTTLRMGLFSLCLVSYFTYLVPMALGWIGMVPFIGALLGAGGCVALLCWRLKRHFPDRPHLIWAHVLAPFLAVELMFAVLYGLKLIPPVPLSLSDIGVYHDVRREGDKFALVMTRPRWKFWQDGDQTFLARPGDRVHLFVSVFSPTRFRDDLQVRWTRLMPEEGWVDSDVRRLPIKGGRDEGYRADLIKTNWEPGDWRVHVETSDRRELGRIRFTVVDDPDTSARRERVVYR